MAVVLEGRDKRNRPAHVSDAISNAIGYAKHRSRSHDAVIRAARTTKRFPSPRCASAIQIVPPAGINR